jgi:protein-disulfide isomerase
VSPHSEEDAAAAAYGLSAVPFFVVVDDEGQVVFRVSGELDTPQLDALVDAADSSRPPA